jgi:protein ImuA
LHLACEAGAEAARLRGRLPPLGLLLCPGEGGAQGVESRWHMACQPSQSTLIENHSAWAMRRTRARMDPPAAWALRRDDRGRISGQALPA